MKLKIAALLIGASFGVAGMAQAAGEIVIKFSHVVSPDTPKGKAAEYFKKLAEERTHGKVKVQVYPNSQLYKDKEELEALQLGAVQMLAPSLAKFGPLGVKEFEVFDLPYVFDNYDEVNKVMHGAIGKQLLGKLESKGIKGLAYWDNGFKNFSSNKPIRTPADLKGMKIRIQSSKVLEEEMRSVGALPQVMAFSEVYQALQTGVVDGTELEASNLYTSKAYEVQKNLTLTQHGFLGYAVIVNKKFWDGLPADVRTQLDGAIADASKYANDIAKKENDRSLAAIKASGKTQVYTPTAAERAAFKKAMLPVHTKMADRIGPDLLKAIYKETGFNPNN
ncbi:TRAP-type C4-dicarboxylate transport system, periplasmic component [Aquitalea magnusonii]|uniref:TRAP-type C4-dicarboxylate transport system, periplasmic component n=1 Tax=Aquitalea magnusonii TaxID=332411 RepID=A0A3G9GEG6_9NEIS|nr:TRAP transporter substrate-binding protein [Aquitalea magnusonii]BBF84492.1 TRAP-type C4-dicarboxylate transport system, periplasmic component [Aquitalea magnusonii]